VTVTTLTNNVPVTGLAASSGAMLAYKDRRPDRPDLPVVTTSGRHRRRRPVRQARRHADYVKL
jgi:hypothetical protein